jgi:hypothetical protein
MVKHNEGDARLLDQASPLLVGNANSTITGESVAIGRLCPIRTARRESRCFTVSLPEE